MGRFIYINRPFNEIEAQLIRDRGFKPLSYDEYDKIRMQFLGTINKKEESFCKKVYKGKKIGPMTPTLMQLSDKNNTMLVLSRGEMIDSADDIKAVVGFTISKNKLRINGVCSNQVTKSKGGSMLVKMIERVFNKNKIVTKRRVRSNKLTKTKR
jgi:hypothetical protein